MKKKLSPKHDANTTKPNERQVLGYNRKDSYCGTLIKTMVRKVKSMQNRVEKRKVL